MLLCINRSHRLKMTLSAHQVRPVNWGVGTGVSSSTFFILLLFINENETFFAPISATVAKLSDISEMVSMLFLGFIFPSYVSIILSALCSSLNHPQALLVLSDVRGALDLELQLMNLNHGGQG